MFIVHLTFSKACMENCLYNGYPGETNTTQFKNLSLLELGVNLFTLYLVVLGVGQNGSILCEALRSQTGVGKELSPS